MAVSSEHPVLDGICELGWVRLSYPHQSIPFCGLSRIPRAGLTPSPPKQLLSLLG